MKRVIQQDGECNTIGNENWLLRYGFVICKRLGVVGSVDMQASLTNLSQSISRLDVAQWVITQVSLQMGSEHKSDSY